MTDPYRGLTRDEFRKLGYANRQRIIRGEPLQTEPPKPEVPEAVKEAKRNMAAARIKAREGKPRKPRGGPGTELKKMTAELGAKYCSSCEGTAHWMDTLGVEGCRRERAAIVERINANRKKLPWVDQLELAAKAVTHVFEWQLSPLDPIGSLVDEAIRRAEINSTP